MHMEAVGGASFLICRRRLVSLITFLICRGRLRALILATSPTHLALSRWLTRQKLRRPFMCINSRQYVKHQRHETKNTDPLYETSAKFAIPEFLRLNFGSIEKINPGPDVLSLRETSFLGLWIEHFQRLPLDEYKVLGIEVRQRGLCNEIIFMSLYNLARNASLDT